MIYVQKNVKRKYIIDKGEVMNSKERQEYWEGYLKYFSNRVAQANDVNDEEKDKITNDENVYQVFDLLEVRQDEKFLDFGCSFCRLYPHVKEQGVEYYGVDIAKSALEQALNLYPELKGNLKVTLEDIIPYEENSFKKLLCFGVFDACIQEKTIQEILRVLEVGGCALITGKNSRYYEDDVMALIAEEKARENKHPNFFTDLEQLIKQLEEKKIKIREVRYFKRRGDTIRNQYVHETPEYFYEYFMIIEKRKEAVGGSFEQFSYEYSETFKKVKFKQG